jgi:hypothetical protein
MVSRFDRKFIRASGFLNSHPYVNRCFFSFSLCFSIFDRFLGVVLFLSAEMRQARRRMDPHGRVQLRLLVLCIFVFATYYAYVSWYSALTKHYHDSESGKFVAQWTRSVSSWTRRKYNSGWDFAVRCWRISDSFVIDATKWAARKIPQYWGSLVYRWDHIVARLHEVGRDRR